MTKSIRKIIKSATANENSIDFVPSDAPVFARLATPDVNPKGKPFTLDVTPETVFCIGFNKAFNSNLRAVAITTLFYILFIAFLLTG